MHIVVSKQVGPSIELYIFFVIYNVYICISWLTYIWRVRYGYVCKFAKLVFYGYV